MVFEELLSIMLEVKEPSGITKEEYVQSVQKGPLHREDYASAWVPVKHPIESPNSITFTKYNGSKKAGVYRWNDEKGIGRGILAVNDSNGITDLAVEKSYRRKGIAQKLLNKAKEDGFTEIGSDEVTEEGAIALYNSFAKDRQSKKE